MGLTQYGTQRKNMSEYDVSEYDCIVFDELALCDIEMLGLVYRYMNNHKQKKFYATADTNQNKPIKYNINNINNFSEYHQKCLYMLFPNVVMLKENKRLKNKEDRDKLKQLKEDIFNKDIPIIDTFKKNGFNFIYKLEDLKTKRNITYFNKRAEKINKYIHSGIKIHNRKHIVECNEIKYYSGLELICRKRFNVGKNIFMINFTYVITKINENEIYLKDICEDDEIILPIKFVTNFSLPYCNTCHAVQGLSINEPITIFDTNTSYVNREWIYTALTRATDFNNVTIFVHSEKETKGLRNAKFYQYLNLKIKGYMEQDKKCHRMYKKEHYINDKWIMFKLHFTDECIKCNSRYYFNYEDGHINSNLTVDRICNDLPHVCSNCQLMCQNCNRAKK